LTNIKAMFKKQKTDIMQQWHCSYAEISIMQQQFHRVLLNVM